MFDAFEIFQLSESFDISEKELELKYLDLSKKNHPDICALRGDPSISARKMELINRAYKILRSKLSRAEYILHRITNFSPSKEAIEWTSIIAEEYSMCGCNLSRLIADFSSEFAIALKKKDYKVASDILFKWKFVEKLQRNNV